MKITVSGLKTKCLTFYYNLYGNENNALDVYLKQSSSYIIWSTRNEDFFEGPSSVKSNFSFIVIVVNLKCEKYNFLQ